MIKETVSHTRKVAFRRCRRLHELMYYRGIRPAAVAMQLAIGTVMHLWLEAWLGTAELGGQPRWVPHTRPPIAPEEDECQRPTVEMALEVEFEKIAARDPYEAARLRAMVLAYHLRWRGQDWRVLRIEHLFRAPFIDPNTGAAHVFTPERRDEPYREYERDGRIDAIIDADGQVWACEHKCVDANTVLLDTATGTSTTVGEMVARKTGIRVPALDVRRSAIVSARSSAPVFAGHRPAFRVSTASGRRLVVSDNHPFWTPSEWVECKRLAPGAYVAVPRALSTDAPDGPYTDAQLRIIGSMIADGGLTNATTGYTKSDQRLLARIVDDAAACGDTVTARRYLNKTALSITFSRDSSVCRLLESLGLIGKGSRDKFIPRIPMSDRQSAVLIGALWDGDGCIDIRPNTAARILYGSRSRQLCEDIQHLLQRIGCLSSLTDTSVLYKGARRDFFQVKVITSASKRRFLDVVPIMRSARPLDEVRDSLANHSRDNRGQPTIEPHIWWDQVLSVEHVGDVDLYDVEVPGTHTFVANGLITHNTHLGPLDPDDDYWIRLRSDAQCSDYHIGAKAIGFDIAGIIYDVVCKPDLDPLKATPVDKREMTIGWGCKACGGDKDARGTGQSKPHTTCLTCKGTGWRPATEKSPSGEPRHKAHVRLHDETPGEYGLRCFQAMVTEPDRYLIRRAVVRLEDELREHERDDWATVQEIDEDRRRDHHPRNPDACFTFGGGGCEFRPVCFGGVDPTTSPLYTISKREPAVIQPPAEEGL